jgi:hypothetical protein
MTDTKRLLLDEGSEEERHLLAAAVAEQPPADGAKRLALALGLGAAELSTPTTAEAATRAALPKLVGAKLALKALLVLGAGAAFAVTLATRTPVSRPSAPLPSGVGANPLSPRPDGAASDSSVSTEPSEQGSALGPAKPSIADEVARLDAVRGALAAGKSELALTTLDAYARGYPRGSLQPEALRLRIEAWLARGDARRARALAQEFLRTFPDSPHAAALRRIAQGGPQADGVR